MNKSIKDRICEFADRFWQSETLEKIIVIICSLYFAGHILVAIVKGWI